MNLFSKNNKKTKPEKNTLNNFLEYSEEQTENSYSSEETNCLSLKTQSGKVLNIRGLDENSTILDVKNYVEFTYGVALSKSGITIPPSETELGVEPGTWNFPNDVPLKKLGVKPNASLEWKSFYSNYKKHMKKNKNIESSDSSSDEKETKYDYSTTIDLEFLVTEKKEEQKIKEKTLKKFHGCLKERGWVFLNVNYGSFKLSKLHEIAKTVKKHMQSLKNSKNKEMLKEWTKLYDQFGYINYNDYKQVLRILTGNIGNILLNKFPSHVRTEITEISKIMDKISQDIINNAFKDYLNQINNVTILNGFKGNKKLKTGMVDFVYYENNQKKQKNSNYPMIKNKINVESHTDPGLFSISFFSDHSGLQLFDVSSEKWIDTYGKLNSKSILWCGECAPKVTNGEIKPGIHRVLFSEKPRFTVWYEACVDSQLSSSLVKAAEKALKEKKNNQN